MLYIFNGKECLCRGGDHIADLYSSRVLTNVVYTSLGSLISSVTKLLKMIPTLDCALDVIALKSASFVSSILK